MHQKKIADMYPLSPMQQGMLFHTLYVPTADVDISQLNCRMHGPLDTAAFVRAWQQVVDHHPTLRSAFIWEERDEPLQVVMQHVELPWQHYDWRGLSADVLRERIQGVFQEDRARGFQLSQPPLMRPTLIRVGDQEHEFVLSHHHLLMDGWSWSMLLGEVFRCYQSFCAGQAPRLVPRRPYRDYILWLKRQDMAEAERFWRQRLAGAVAATPIAGDRRSEDESPAASAYEQHEVRLAAETTAQLQQLARAQALTLNTIVQGAWAILLSHYSGQDDVVFGVTSSGRPAELAGVEQMIGLFINTLPARFQVQPDERLAAWLQHQQARQTEALRYEYSPLVQIHGWSEVPRGQPLFETLLVFDNNPVDGGLGSVAGQLPVRVEFVQSVERTNYPITVRAVPGSELTIQMGCDTACFDGALIRRMLGQLRHLLEQIVATPGALVGDLAVLTPAEQQEILVDWNATQVAYPQGQCLHEVFEAQALRTPDRLAVSCRGVELSYRELDARANQLAHALRQLGVGPDVLVGLCLERSVEMVVGLLGILKAGGAYVPLDPAYPPDRLAFMLEDSGTSVLITTTTDHRPPTTDPFDKVTRRQGEAITVSGSLVVFLDSDWPTIAQHPTTPPSSAVVPDHLAYVIYTSGSTGRPKGAMISHRAIVNHMRWMQDALCLTPDDRALHRTPISFDGAGPELYAPLLAGAALLIATQEGVQDSRYLVQRLRDDRISVLALVPSLLRVLVDEPEFDQCRALKHVSCGGEPLPTAVQRRFQARSSARLYNFYGPTEAAVDTTYWPCTADLGGRTVPIGRPISNMQTYVLDGRMRLVPLGVPGELYIGGTGLARGYLNRPELTAERFIPNPFAPTTDDRSLTTDRAEDRGWGIEDSSPDASEMRSSFEDRGLKVASRTADADHQRSAILDPPSSNGADRRSSVVGRRASGVGERLYRTGDMVRWRPDGTLEFMGRVDHQVKLRGFRIELGEIEAALARHAAVREAVVLIREDTPGDQRLVAYLIPQGEERPSTSALRAFLKPSLPEYMLPAAFVLLEALPLSPNGKVDRRALAAPADARPDLETHFVAPRSPLEQTLAQAWAGVLGHDQIGIDDNFFDLGGHSLQAIQLVSKLGAALGQPVSVRQLFLTPTIAGLAEALQPGEPAPVAPSAEPIQPPAPIANPWVRLERRPLLTLAASGQIAPVDSAAISCLQYGVLASTGLAREQVLSEWFDHLPVVFRIQQTALGRIAEITIPRLSTELYDQQEALVEQILAALEQARTLGARTASLTGLLPSATAYGAAIRQAARPGLPAITTGHATTVAAVVLATEHLVEQAGRSLGQERVALIGAGSIGAGTLQLLLRVLAYPAELLICDLFSKRAELEHLRQAVQALGFSGPVHLIESRGVLPDACYDATLIIGATNVPDILDLERVRPGTLIVDDSAPHCFSPAAMIERFEARADLLFTEGGVLHDPHPIDELRYLPKMVDRLPNAALIEQGFALHRPHEITGCILSSLLSARDPGLEPTVGPVEPGAAYAHYVALQEQGFQAPPLHCEYYVLDPGRISQFRERYGCTRG